MAGAAWSLIRAPGISRPGAASSGIRFQKPWPPLNRSFGKKTTKAPPASPSSEHQWRDRSDHHNGGRPLMEGQVSSQYWRDRSQIVILEGQAR